MFDANINKKHENYWRCERHGGVNNHDRANAKDEDCRDGIPGAARRMRFARFRAKQQPADTIFMVSTFLDKPERKTPVKKMTAKSTKELRREAALAELGLTEADIIKFAESN